MNKDEADFFKQYNYVHISKEVDKAQTMMDKVRSGELKPLHTSSNKEKEKIGGYYFSDQIVVAGRTGTGKSAKMFHDMLDFANVDINPTYVNDLLILLDSYEMPGWRVVNRLTSRMAEVEVKALLDYQQRLSEERYRFLKDVSSKFKGLPIWVTNRPLTSDKWLESKKQIQGKFPKKKIINIFDHTRLGLKKDESKEEAVITGFMVAGVHLKNNFDMMNFFLSQMNRNIETSTNRDRLGSNLPVSSDIFGSDAVFQCADVVLALHRPGYYGLEDFEGIPTGKRRDDPNSEDDLLIECVLKQREGWTGNILMKHNLAINKIEDYPTEQDRIQQLLTEDF